VPDAGRDLQQAGRCGREEELLDLSVGLRLFAAVVEDDTHVARRDDVAVGLELVHAPALDPARSDRELVRVDDRFVPERIARVQHLSQRATVVGEAC